MVCNELFFLFFKIICQNLPKNEEVLDSNNFSIGIHSFKVLVQIHYSHSQAPQKVLFSYFPIFHSIFGFCQNRPKKLKKWAKIGQIWRKWMRKKSRKKYPFCERFPNYSVYFASEKCTKYADLKWRK